MALANGEVFADYTILRVLGSGGMGEVYLAEHPRLPRQDALKVLGADVSHDAEYRQRFNQEAEMVATLRHPNIVTIYDRGECDGRLWISMEYVEGTDAARLLTERYPDGIPAAEVVRIVSAVAEALDYAHSRFLLHRDIKPANILIGHPAPEPESPGLDRIMLADFGVARWVGQTSTLTATDMTVGTVTYAAPEQLKGEEIDGRADQYALAATAYHLLTGSAPFDNTNPTAVISAHLTAPPPPIGDDNPDLSRFGPVFTKALAKNPADRYPSCRDFAEALQDALGESGGVSSRRRGAATMSRRNRVSRWNRWIVAVLGGVILAGIAAAHWMSDHRSVEERPAPTTPPPPAESARMDLPVVVIGADCAVLGAAAVDATGAPAFCARGVTEAPVWSVQPGTLRTTVGPPLTSVPGQS